MRWGNGVGHKERGRGTDRRTDRETETESERNIILATEIKTEIERYKDREKQIKSDWKRERELQTRRHRVRNKEDIERT